VVVVTFRTDVRLVSLKTTMPARTGGYGRSARAVHVDGVVVVAVVSVAAVSGVPEMTRAARGVVYGWFGGAGRWSLWLLVCGGL